MQKALFLETFGYLNYKVNIFCVSSSVGQICRLSVRFSFYWRHLCGDATVVDGNWIWHRLESAPTKRCAHAAAVIKDRLCHFGGWDGYSTIFSDILIYNTDVNTWDTQNVMLSKACQQQALPERRFGHSSCSLNNSFVIVVGGVNATSDLNDLFAIKPNF